MIGSRNILIYVSGPITPTERFPDLKANRQRILDKSKELFDRGYSVYCPVTAWEADTDGYDEHYENLLAMDKEIVKRCDTLYLLQGREHSKGACKENAWATEYGLLILHEPPQGEDS